MNSLFYFDFLGQRLEEEAASTASGMRQEEYVFKLLVEKMDLHFPKTATALDLLQKLANVLKVEGKISLTIPTIANLSWPLAESKHSNFLFLFS